VIPKSADVGPHWPIRAASFGGSPTPYDCNGSRMASEQWVRAFFH
jgi:hypothetical protein